MTSSGVPALGLGTCARIPVSPVGGGVITPLFSAEGGTAVPLSGPGASSPCGVVFSVAPGDAARSDPFGTVASNSRAAKTIMYSFTRDCIVLAVCRLLRGWRGRDRGSFRRRRSYNHVALFGLILGRWRNWVALAFRPGGADGSSRHAVSLARCAFRIST